MRSNYSQIVTWIRSTSIFAWMHYASFPASFDVIRYSGEMTWRDTAQNLSYSEAVNLAATWAEEFPTSYITINPLVEHRGGWTGFGFSPREIN